MDDAAVDAYYKAHLAQYMAPESVKLQYAELRLDQLFAMRPVAGWARYATPVRGLFLCGSGTHPGGGVTGAPGHNAAKQILRTTSMVFKKPY